MILSASSIFPVEPASSWFDLIAVSTNAVTRSEFQFNSVLCFSTIAAMLSCITLPSVRIEPNRSSICATATLMVFSMYSRCSGVNCAIAADSL